MTQPAQGIHDHPTRKLGVRPRIPRPALQMAAFIDVPAVAAAADDHPVSDDNFAAFTAAGHTFGLYHNDVAGCCGPTMLCNDRRLSSFIAGAYDEPTDPDMWRVYESQNPGFDPNGTKDTNGPESPYDGGVENQSMFDWVHKNGLGVDADGNERKLLAFAQVDHRNLDAIKAGVYKFDSVCIAVTLDTAQQDQSDGANPVWVYVVSPEWGGHDVMSGKYFGQADADGVVVSWAEFIAMADTFMNRQIDECWVLIWEENYNKLSDAEKAALASEYQALTGRPFPVAPPTPGPTPTPGPSPTPVDVDTQLAAVARAYLPHHWHKATQTAELRDALQAWLDTHYPEG